MMWKGGRMLKMCCKKIHELKAISEMWREFCMTTTSYSGLVIACHREFLA